MKFGKTISVAGMSAALLLTGVGSAVAADVSATAAPCRQYTLPTGVPGKANTVCISFDNTPGTLDRLKLSWRWQPADSNHYVVAQVEEAGQSPQGRIYDIGLTPGIDSWSKLLRRHAWVKGCYGKGQCGVSQKIEVTYP